MKDIAAPLAQALDGVLPVCTGSSRTSKKWTNTTITWGDLCQRLGKTQRTGETVEQYHAMSKDEKAKVKDVGGIVCGHLKHDKTSDDKTMAGRKTKDNILNRSIVTLDMDECPEGLNPVEIISEKLPGIAAVAYTTHSHTPEAPRWRIFIPLFEWVTPFYYEGIARWIGNEIGMQYLDKTTFQYNRLMYWPSTSSDGEYLCKVVDGSPISPRKFYEAYPAMKRESAWPRHPDEEPVEKRSPLHEREGEYSAAGKPGAPAEKPGIIGAFCRAYPIEEAISTFLGEVYKPEGLGRYTYINGSSSGGLIIDGEGKAYSFHGTDPANTGHSLNAFDLVRIHKFGHLDKDANAGCKGNNLPSYQAMCTWCAEDSRVRGLLNKELIEHVEQQESKDSRSHIPGFDELLRGSKGEIKKCYENFKIIMLNDPVLSRIRRNAFTGNDEIDDPMLIGCESNIIDDSALFGIATIFERKYNVYITKDKVDDTLEGVSGLHSYHPVKDYILSAAWDHIERLETALIEYMGAPDTPLVRAQTRKWFVGAVKRIFDPGCKFDYMLVLVGPQGVGKSTFFSLIANNGEYYNESLTFDMEFKTFVETLVRGWIFEIPEMAGMKSVREQEKVKSILSMTGAYARKAYGRRVKYYPRHCALAATTNERGFLNDLNSRKFWVIDVAGDPDLRSKLTDKTIRQLWAEAYVYYTQNESIYLPKDLEEESRKASIAHNTAFEDPRLGDVLAYLEYLLPDNWRELSRDARTAYIKQYTVSNGNGPDFDFRRKMRRNRVCVAEVKNELDDIFRKYPDKTSPQYVNRLLSLTGWELYDDGEKHIVDKIYGQQRNIFIRPHTDGEDEVILTDCDDDSDCEAQKPYRAKRD